MATELITNGSFETGTGINPQGWTGTSPGRVDRNANLAADGTGWYTLSADGPSHGGAVSQTISTQAGKTYTLTFKAGIGWQPTTTGNFNATMNVEMLNGATLIKATPVELSGNKSVGWGTYTVTFTATGPSTTLRFTDTSPNGQADFDVGLDKVSVQESGSANTGGKWGDVQPWPLIPIHSVVTQDGKVLTFGTNLSGGQGATMYHDLYDPVTGMHHTIDHQTHTPTDIFCSAAIIIPGTDKILISGGDARPLGSPNGPVNDSNFFSNTTHQVSSSPEGEMTVARWYNTMVSLASGQIVNLGGSGSGGVVEIFTEGEGWRKLPGATDAEVASSWSYPRAWVGGTGEIFYYATGGGTNGSIELMALDPSGLGSIRKVGTLPFWTDETSPAIMYEAGKTLIMASNGELWTMDITGSTPVYTKIGIAGQDRNYSNMTLLADGKVLINGGTANGNTEAASIKTAAIWNPDTGQLTQTPAEMYTRVYHSTSVLLADGTVLSGGGGSAGMAENDYLNAQIYKPPYLFDANGNLAVRPVITDAPKEIEPGDAFTITVDNAASITKLTMIKTGATTHTFNMDARSVDVTFTKGPGNTITVDTPDNVNDMTAGSWMLFAWNDKGVPSVAPIIAVAPTVSHYEADGSGGDVMPMHVHHDNMVIDGSFEAFQGDIGNSAWKIFTNGQVGAWQSSNNSIELWSDGNNGVNAPGARILTEVDAVNGVLSQQITTEAGKGYDLSFDLAGRPGYIASSKVEVLWNGVVVATVAPTDSTFKTYAFKVTGTGAADTLAFRSVAGDTDSVGGLLDKVALTPAGQMPGGDYNMIMATGAGGYMAGTDAADHFMGAGGNDVFYAKKGNDIVDGAGGDYNQVDLDGSAADWTFTRNADGSIKAENATYGSKTLTEIDGVFFYGSGKWASLSSLVTEPAGTINMFHATAAGGYVAGTSGADHFMGAGGVDVFYARGGNDIVDGAGGDYNQVDLDGSASEWTFTKNANGSVTAVHATFGTKTLTEIDGVFFYGSGSWASIDSLAKGPAGTINTIIASSAGGYLAGTAGDDHFIGGAGNDSFSGKAGNDVYDGGGGAYNQVDLAGSIADWDFSRNADGSVTATSHTNQGTDTLHDIDGIWFEGASEWRSVDSLIA